jgi:DcaP outer membrane protein
MIFQHFRTTSTAGLAIAAAASAFTHDACAQERASNAVTGGATTGSFKLSGSDTSVTLGGYVKLGAVASDRSAGVASSADQQYEAGAVPVGPNAGANERYQVKLHARQSRLFGKTSTPSDWGLLTTHVDFDLFGAAGNESVSDSHGLRVRHACGTLGGLLAGQTWTIFSDVATYPETVDFGGPAGTIFARQKQLRWTQPFDGGQWSVALENPETVVALPSGASFRADDDRMPDLAANVRVDLGSARLSVAALARQLRIDSAGAPAATNERWGGGLGINAVIPSIGKDDARLSLYAGNALGRYTMGFFTDALLDGN